VRSSLRDIIWLVVIIGYADIVVEYRPEMIALLDLSNHRETAQLYRLA
jgi:hypothetical protein